MWAVLWSIAVVFVVAAIALAYLTRRAARGRRAAHGAAVRALADDMASTGASVETGARPGSDPFVRSRDDEPAPATSALRPPLATAPSAPGLHASIGRPPTILVVDDEPAVRELAASVLALAGYHVLTAESGHAALDIWQVYGDTIDLLLTDVVMPQGMSGPQLALALLAEAPGLPVVFTSGYSAETDVEGFTLEPGVNFLQKPYQLGMLVRVVRQAMERAPSI